MHVFFNFSGRHLPDKAIDLVDEACANVRVQLDSQPEEIDNLERKKIQLEVELHALEKEKDKVSKARLAEVAGFPLTNFGIFFFVVSSYAGYCVFYLLFSVNPTFCTMHFRW